jgi:hypothetical protein
MTEKGGCDRARTISETDPVPTEHMRVTRNLTDGLEDLREFLRSSGCPELNSSAVLMAGNSSVVEFGRPRAVEGRRWPAQCPRGERAAVRCTVHATFA